GILRPENRISAGVRPRQVDGTGSNGPDAVVVLLDHGDPVDEAPPDAGNDDRRMMRRAPPASTVGTLGGVVPELDDVTLLVRHHTLTNPEVQSPRVPVRGERRGRSMFGCQRRSHKVGTFTVAHLLVR